MKIEPTPHNLPSSPASSKYSPVAKFDDRGQLHNLNPDENSWDEGFVRHDSAQLSVVRIELDASTHPACGTDNKIGPSDEGYPVIPTDSVKAGVANIPTSLGGYGATLGNLLDIFA
ncbi:hypothetical protein KS4_11850 [Poriferisphaera corsica]|uniref:Uncharacterized protein n=1 Tax=Poriferisphaera corsica TaxID=2528020 RepID=A0A517YSE1_9BACT|nr:hypothetical protein [Poriferisphaera corsica]QDU33140.1 hypothetical protein KS4_11850 [Poriferisphaera corsica]